MQPVTRYAKSADVHIAYQVFGEGPVNLILAPPFVSNIENNWTFPDLERWLLRLASFARVVMFDKRGTGMSDRVAELPGLDQRIDDLRAVMDAASMEQAALLGISEGSPLAALFARPILTGAERWCCMVALYAFRLGSRLRRRLPAFLAISTRLGAAAAACLFSRPRWRMIRPLNNGWGASSGLAPARPPLLHSCG